MADETLELSEAQARPRAVVYGALDELPKAGGTGPRPFSATS